jgi:hypothetical protein
VSSGSAYIQGLGKVLRSTSAIAKAGLSLTASTWYHVYLYSNAGTPDVEISTTAPAAAYYGTARSKSGDSSRRYVGSILTNSSGSIYGFSHLVASGRVMYVTNINPAPFLVVNGTATTATDVDCSGVVPVTSNRVVVFAANNDTSVSVYLGNSISPPVPGSSFLAYVGILPCIYAGELPLDSARKFQYVFVAAHTGNFVTRVSGYVFER